MPRFALRSTLRPAFVSRIFSVLALVSLTIAGISAHAQAATALTLTATPSTIAVPAVTTLTATVIESGTGNKVTAGYVVFGLDSSCTSILLECTGGGPFLGTAQIVRSGASMGTATLKAKAFRAPAIGGYVYAYYVGDATDASTSGSAALTTTTTGFATTSGLTISGAQGAYSLTTSYTFGAQDYSSTPISQQVVDTATGANILPNLTPGAFTSTNGYTAGTVTSGNPYGSVVGDFNKDGYPDLIVGNTSGTLGYTVYLGKADGTFNAGVFHSLGGSNTAFALFASDLNGDGNLDLVVRQTAGTLSYVALGNGDGTFGTATTVAIITDVLVDMNGDGIPDLVGYGAGSVLIATGKGDGTFNTPVATAVSSLLSSASMAVADVDQNGTPDLIVAHGSNKTIGVLLNTGGVLAPETLITLPSTVYAVAAGDIDGSGNASILVLNGTSLTTLVNDASGTVANFPAKTVSLGASTTANSTISFVTRGPQGVADVIVSYYNAAQIAYLATNYDGTFVQTNFSPGVGYVRATYPVDANTDGTPDILAVGGSGFATLLATTTYTQTYTGAIPGGGTRTLQFQSGADATVLASNSTTVTATGTPIATTLGLVPTANTVAAGGTTTITAQMYTVNGYGNAITGTVAFTDNGTTICAAATLSSNVATCTTPALSSGAHNYVATYSGNTNFAASSGKTAVRAGAALTTTTTLTPSATSVTGGAAVTLTANVKDAAAANVKGGLVNFCNAAATTCTGANLYGTVQVQASNGNAVVTLIAAGGVHVYKAVYLGDNFDATSTSANQTVSATASQATTTTFATAGTTGNYSLTGTVSTTGGTGVTGTVKFVDTGNGNAQVATATLGAPTYGAATLTGATAFSGAAFTYSTGPSVLADFNNDGKLDVLQTINTTPKLYLGNGDGTFGSAISVGPTANVSQAVVGDINGDGNLDVVTFNQTYNTQTNTTYYFYTAFLGNGAGAFTAQPTVALSYGGGGILVDTNGDGILDLFISSADQMCFGNGDGTFQPCRAIPSLNGTGNIFTADLNGDGRLDAILINANSNNSVTTYLANADATFTATGYTGHVVATSTAVIQGGIFADFDGDGKTDLIAVGDSYNSPYAVYLYFMKGNGDGTFGTPVPIATTLTGGFQFCYAVDANLDGKMDLLCVQQTGGTFGSTFVDSAFYGNGDGTFQSAVTLNNFPFNNGDFNNDGRTDVVTDKQVLLATSTQSAMATATGVSIAGGGTHTIAAAYQGDSGYVASTSPTIGLSGSPTPTTLAVSAPASATYGQSVALVATVSPSTSNGQNASGTVLFKSNGSNIASCTNISVSGGSATCNTKLLGFGADSISAVYAGDANFATSSTTSSASITISQGTAGITASAPAVAYGTATDTLTATITYPGATAPTGAVTFSVDGGAATTASCNSSAGTETCTVSYNTSALTTSSHNLTASLAADTNYAAATSTTATFTVSKRTVVVTASAPGMVFATATETLTATIPFSGTTAPSGTVTFSVDGGAAQTAACSATGTVETCTYPFASGALTVGSHNLSATLATDTNTNAANSAVTTFAVTKQTPGLVASAGNVSNGTATDILTAQLSFTGTTVPTGAVTLTVDATAPVTATCSGTTSPLTCTYAYNSASLTVGTHTVKATYAGDTNFVGITSASSNFSVTQQVPTVTLTIPSVNYGATTATLSASIAFTGATVPTGAFTFTVNGGSNLTATCTGATSPRTCTYTYNPSALAAGGYTVTGALAADANFAATAATPGTLTVNKIGATIVAVAPTIVYGATTDAVTANVSYSGTAAPTGAVTFSVDSSFPQAGTCTGATSPRTCNFTASTGSLTAGTHSLVVMLASDANYNSAFSPSANLVVTKQTPTLTAAATNVSYGTASDTATATLSFTGTSAPFGNVLISIDGGSAVTSTCTGASSPQSCTISFNSSALAAGTHSVSASYAGDSNYGAVASAAGSFTIAQVASAVGLNATAGGGAGSSVVLTGSISGAGGSFSSGTMTFSDNGSVVCSAVAISNNAATCTSPPLVSGSNSFTVAFSGGAQYQPSNDNATPLVITVDPPTNTGTGSTPPGGTSAPFAEAITFPTAFTLGNVALTNYGAAGNAFTIVAGGTCPTTPGATVPAGGCTVNVTFANVAPGLLTGLIAITDSNGNVVGTISVATLGVR